MARRGREGRKGRERGKEGREGGRERGRINYIIEFTVSLQKGGIN